MVKYKCICNDMKLHPQCKAYDHNRLRLAETQLADANKKVAELEAPMKCYECGCGMVEYNGHAIKEIERLEAEVSGRKQDAESLCAQIAELKGVLTRCTEHLGKSSYELSSGCNGILVVDKHLETILEYLAKTEDRRAHCIAKYATEATKRIGQEVLADDYKQQLTEERAKAKELDQFLTDACNERDEYATRAEDAEAVCQVLATQVSLARSGDDGKTRQVSEILDKAREQVKGAE